MANTFKAAAQPADAFKPHNVLHFFPPDERSPEEIARAMFQELAEKFETRPDAEAEFMEKMVPMLVKVETECQQKIAEEFVKLQRAGLDFADAIEILVFCKGPPEDLSKWVRQVTRFVLQDGHSIPDGKTYGLFVGELTQRILHTGKSKKTPHDCGRILRRRTPQ